MFDWIQKLADWIVYALLKVAEGSHLGEAVDFFIFETLKVLILLLIIVFVMGIINSYMPVERLRSMLVNKKFFGLEYFFASLFGAITPFCSCSSVPLFIGFVQGGIPLGVTFAFLITSPLVNEVALALFISMFGVKLTLIYAFSGIFLGTMGGWILGKLNLQNLLSDWVQQIWENSGNANIEYSEDELPFTSRLPQIFREATDIVKQVFLYVIVGIAIGAAAHGYVPENFFEAYLSGDQWWTVPLAVILAVPLYSNAAGIVPVIQVLVAKGVPIGTAIAFMMSTVGLSLPEATLLKKVMTMKLIGIFFGTVTLFIILSGFLFNLVL